MPQQLNKKQLLATVAKLASAATIGPRITSREPYRLFGGVPNDVAFISPDNLTLLQRTVNEFWNADPSLRDTLSRRTIERAVIDFVRQAHEPGQMLQASDIDQAFADLRALPSRSWEVFRPLAGAILVRSCHAPWAPRAFLATRDWFTTGQPHHRLKARLRRNVHTVQPVQLGPFTILDPLLHIDQIADAYPTCPREEIAHKLRAFYEGRARAVISVKVVACDNDRRNEVADARFAQFESIIRYMIARTDRHYDVGIFDPDESRVLDFVALTSEVPHAFGGWHVTGGRELVDLADPFFVRPDLGYDRVWALVDDANRPSLRGADPLAARFLSAIAWIGKGVRDQDAGRRFIQFMFALEALFTSRDVDVPISDRLAEYTAFVLADNYDDRSRIATLTKTLYGKRSDVAHGRASSVSDQDVDNALGLVKGLVIALLTKPAFANMVEMAQLENWARQQRYS